MCRWPRLLRSSRSSSRSSSTNPPLPHRPSLHAPPRRRDHHGDASGSAGTTQTRHSGRLPERRAPWNDRNRARSLPTRVAAFLAHIRASTGTPVQQTNLPPRFAKPADGSGSTTVSWRDFVHLKRELALTVDESLYTSIEGSTDSGGVALLPSR